MSFTQDELQSFNTILEQKLSIHRRELERSFDQRMSVLQREFEQRLTSIQQDILRNLPARLSDQQNKLKDIVGQHLEEQQTRIAQSVNQEIELFQHQQQQMLEVMIERTLAAQLLAIEQLITQRLPIQPADQPQLYENMAQPAVDAIEVQTEVSWEDLVEVIDKTISERLSSLEESIQSTVKTTEHYLLAQLHTLRTDLAQGRQHYSGDITSIQDVFTSIEQLERIIESMQVAMTANHALLSNRLYHHQHLPLERAHPGSQTSGTNNVHGESKNNQLPQPKEQEAEQRHDL
jgi:hypothetical protein